MTRTHTLHRSRNFLTMLIFPILSFLLSATLAMPTANSISVLDQLQKRDAMCYEAQRAGTVALNPVDCTAAVLTIPMTRAPGGSGITAVISQFGNSLPNGSPFKLPRHFAFGGCMVGVTMVSPYGHAEETSSWNEIAVSAHKIVTDCVARPVNRRGGANKAGSHNGILIEMFLYQAQLHFLLDLNTPTFVPPPGVVGQNFRRGAE